MKQNFVAGAWVAGATATANINPSNTDDVIGHYADATAEQVATAAQAARDAAEGWGRALPSQRAGLLQAIATALDAQRADLAILLSREEGKALRDATGEVARSADIFRFYAGEVYRMGGESIGSVRAGVSIDVLHEPMGVVGLITLWNFPLAIPAWKIAPALAYGNTVLFKPSELVPACAWALCDIIQKAGAPAGVFNLLMGGGEVGRMIIDAVDAVSFTGSVPTGNAVALRAAQRMIPAQCEF
jgi:alpha-ketoglutaric semialdehyde dehydrogenase